MKLKGKAVLVFLAFALLVSFVSPLATIPEVKATLPQATYVDDVLYFSNMPPHNDLNFYANGLWWNIRLIPATGTTNYTVATSPDCLTWTDRFSDDIDAVDSLRPTTGMAFDLQFDGSILHLVGKRFLDNPDYLYALSYRAVIPNANGTVTSVTDWQTIKSFSSFGYVNFWGASLTLDASNRPWISYCYKDTEPANDTMTQELTHSVYSNGTWQAPSTGEELIESEESVGSYLTIKSTHPSSGPTYNFSALGNAYTPDADIDLSKVAFYLAKSGSPTTNLTANIYLLDGSHLPTGSALVVSDALNSSTLTTGGTWYNFSLSYTLSDGVEYGVILQAGDSGTVNDSNYIKVYHDSVDVESYVNYDSAWHFTSNNNFMYQIYGAYEGVITYPLDLGTFDYQATNDPVLWGATPEILSYDDGSIQVLYIEEETSNIDRQWHSLIIENDANVSSFDTNRKIDPSYTWFFIHSIIKTDDDRVFLTYHSWGLWESYDTAADTVLLEVNKTHVVNLTKLWEFDPDGCRSVVTRYIPEQNKLFIQGSNGVGEYHYHPNYIFKLYDLDTNTLDSKEYLLMENAFYIDVFSDIHDSEPVQISMEPVDGKFLISFEQDTDPYEALYFTYFDYDEYFDANITVSSVPELTVSFTIDGEETTTPLAPLEAASGNTYTLTALNETVTVGDTTYTFYCWDVVSGLGSFNYSDTSIIVELGGSLDLEIEYTTEEETPGILPSLSVGWIWPYLFEGDFIGFFNAVLASALGTTSIAIAIITMLFLVPLYLRTQSLLLLVIAWFMLGGFIIVAVPVASGLAIIFCALGIGGLLWRLLRPSSS